MWDLIGATNIVLLRACNTTCNLVGLLVRPSNADHFSHAFQLRAFYSISHYVVLWSFSPLVHWFVGNYLLDNFVAIFLVVVILMFAVGFIVVFDVVCDVGGDNAV